jgi:hypothetical protein
MVERPRNQGCCASSDCPTNFEDRLELGRRRLLLLRRVSVLGSGSLTLVALVLLASGSDLAGRVAWAAAVWGLPMLLRWARQLMSGRRVMLPLLLAAGLVAAGVAGWPIVPALAVATLLTVDLLRQGNRRDVAALEGKQRHVAFPAG